MAQEPNAKDEAQRKRQERKANPQRGPQRAQPNQQEQGRERQAPPQARRQEWPPPGEAVRSQRREQQPAPAVQPQRRQRPTEQRPPVQARPQVQPTPAAPPQAQRLRQAPTADAPARVRTDDRRIRTQEAPATPEEARRIRQAPSVTSPSGSQGPRAGVERSAAPRSLEDVRSQRVRTVTKSGATVIQEPGNRMIVRDGRNTFIAHDEGRAIQRFAPGARTVRRKDGVVESVVTRPGGVRVISEVDRNGRLLRRYRTGPDGRRHVYVDNRRFYRNAAIGIGVGLASVAVIAALTRPTVAMPRDRYIVDYDRASDDDLYDVLIAPPVSRLDRTYSLAEVRYNEPLRAYMRRIDLDNITFDSGSFEVTPDQFRKLDRMARAMDRAIRHNPEEVFLIEGHTDAVGNDDDNLTLSDRRAEAVARILVEEFRIPFENLATQGYGEQFLKIENRGPERQNRRVAVRRITPLLSRN
ncbi:MAG: OmpA family protein [Hyphomicrobiaceae bacterium]